MCASADVYVHVLFSNALTQTLQVILYMYCLVETDGVQVAHCIMLLATSNKPL